jgi:hypothetical protein
MPSRSPQFLRNPSEIRAKVKELQSGRRLDLAVAFVGLTGGSCLAITGASCV